MYRFAKEFYLFRHHNLLPWSVQCTAPQMRRSSLVKYSVCKCRLAFLEEGSGASTWWHIFFLCLVEKGPVFVFYFYIVQNM